MKEAVCEIIRTEMRKREGMMIKVVLSVIPLNLGYFFFLFFQKITKTSLIEKQDDAGTERIKTFSTNKENELTCRLLLGRRSIYSFIFILKYLS